MGLVITIGYLALPDEQDPEGTLPALTLLQIPGAPRQDMEHGYSNRWGMSYQASQWGNFNIPWFRQLTQGKTWALIKLTEDIPDPVVSDYPVPEDLVRFTQWFSFWRNYALENFKDPYIVLN